MRFHRRMFFVRSLVLSVAVVGTVSFAAACAPLASITTDTPNTSATIAIDLPPVATEAPAIIPAAGVAPPPLAPIVAPSEVVTAAETVTDAVIEAVAAPDVVVLPTPTTMPVASVPPTDAPPGEIAPTAEAAPTSEAFAPLPDAQTAIAESDAGAGSDRFYAVVVPFDTVRDDISLEDVRAIWQGESPLFTTQDALDLLPALLGAPAETTSAIATDALIGALEADRSALGILPFEQLDPRFKVLTVDGVNLLSNQLMPGGYPLIAAGAGGNRDAGKLTTLVVTGVTAIARGTGAAIERAGRTTYPAEIIGPELALADITHVSNEIPFLADCIVENYENNLVLCSHTSYWDALELMGTDIVGLSGNHVNDFGRDGARESLTWYKENGIPIYGSGFTVDEACAPLLWEDHGNTFAFIAALAYGPESAWVTDEEPGACYYYEHKDRILNTIRLLSQAVDVVSVELQYEETYFPWPTPLQVTEFRELRNTGADIVTGVQSHVPQAQEPYGNYDAGGPGMISYGLGNLYFDQMWSWETRTELYARHAIYDGKLISTEILTGVLEDFAQPRWTTPEERAELLQTIFDAAPERP